MLKMTKSARYLLHKVKGHVFSEVAEVPQAAVTQTHRAGRPYKFRQKRKFPADMFNMFSKMLTFVISQHLNLEMCRGAVSTCPKKQIVKTFDKFKQKTNHVLWWGYLEAL